MLRLPVSGSLAGGIGAAQLRHSRAPLRAARPPPTHSARRERPSHAERNAAADSHEPHIEHAHDLELRERVALRAGEGMAERVAERAATTAATKAAARVGETTLERLGGRAAQRTVFARLGRGALLTRSVRALAVCLPLLGAAFVLYLLRQDHARAEEEAARGNGPASLLFRVAAGCDCADFVAHLFLVAAMLHMHTGLGWAVPKGVLIIAEWLGVMGAIFSMATALIGEVLASQRYRPIPRTV